MEQEVRKLFERYEDLFQRAMSGDLDMQQMTSSYARVFIAASPAGVHAGKNDAKFKQVLRQGIENYRRIGTKSMRVRSVDIVPIDEHHCIARVGWTAVYDRGKDPDVTIEFEVHYLVQQLDGSPPRIFGWVSGDEQAVLKQHGII